MCDKDSPLAKKKSVTFKYLAGISFIVLQDIGPWKQIKENAIPKNRIDFYAVYRKDQRKSVAPLLDLLSKNWPNDNFSN